MLRRSQPLRDLHRGRDDLGGEHVFGGADRCELQLLLGVEMGVEPALAHPDFAGEAADREALETLKGGKTGGGVENHAVAALAVGAGASLACLVSRHGFLPESCLTS